MTTRNINLSSSQSNIITESAAIMPRLRTAIDTLKQNFDFQLDDVFLTLMENWVMEQSMSVSYGDYVVNQAMHYQGSAKSDAQENLVNLMNITDPVQFKKELFDEFITQSIMIKLAIEMITENPFNTQVFTSELPRGKMHTIIKFDDVNPQNKEVLNAIYYSTAALSEVAYYINKTYNVETE